jgi:hypothetical protein
MDIPNRFSVRWAAMKSATCLSRHRWRSCECSRSGKSNGLEAINRYPGPQRCRRCWNSAGIFSGTLAPRLRHGYCCARRVFIGRHAAKAGKKIRQIEKSTLELFNSSLGQLPLLQ